MSKCWYMSPLHVCLSGIKTRNCSSLDQMRYFLASTTDKPASHLTPREDAFKRHVYRARYQTNI
jgi:hypothetical protein